MKTMVYQLSMGAFAGHLRFALVADLHGGEPDEVIRRLKDASPDYILMPGDIFERLDGADDRVHENAMRLMRECAKIAPSFYSTGNHEDGGIRSWSPFWRFTVKDRVYDRRDLAAIEEAGVTMLTNEFVLRDGIAFGGLCSGLIREGQKPELEWLEEFCRVEAPKVLLCHHPEYFKQYLRELPIDLIVSGHAHGGQWRFFGRGVFAPGQGLFPKYTAGVHGNRLVISRGLKKSGTIPRIFNEPELVVVELI